MNLYACAGYVQNQNGEIRIVPANCIANNEDEAIGKFIKYMREQYSAKSGYYNHMAGVIPVTMDRIDAVYLANHKEE